MRSILNLLETKKFQISTILCFLLPPVGILFLFIFSFVTFQKTWRDNKHLYISLISLFFLCLFISTIGAVIQMRNVFLLVASIMILGYWGLYISIMSNGSKDNFRDYKWIMIFGGIYNCLIGWTPKWTSMNPALGIVTGTKLLGDTDYSRLFGSSYNSNFAMYLLLLAIAFIFAEMHSTIRKKKFVFLSWQIPLLLILSNGVIATGSRAGFMTMVLIYLLFFLRLNKIFFFTILILFLVQMKKVFELMPRKELINYSTQVREKIWTNSIELWKQHPIFGMTPLGFRDQYRKFFNIEIVHSHNIFIGFFAEYGILGGIAFLILLFTTIYKSVSLFFYKENKNGLLDYFLFSLPIIVFTGILDEPIFSPQIALLTIILLAYWDKYTKNFSFSFLDLPKTKLRKIQKRYTAFIIRLRYNEQKLK